MRVALVHDYLRQYGEAERLLTVLHQMYPQAPVYTAFVDRASLGTTIDQFAGWDLRTTPAQTLPGIGQYYQKFRAFLPYFWESLDLSEYDLVISSSGDYCSKAVLTRSETLHITYCHTPPRQLWQESNPSPWWRYSAQLNTRLRQYDFQTAQRVDRFITNSETVARRIRKFYRRSAEVIPPPVQVHGRGEAGADYYLYIGDLTRQQQVELAVRACTNLDRPLYVVGTGSEEARLKGLAGKTVKFLGPLPPPEIIPLYASARALIFPWAEADFGFAPVEAMGRGVPVIASGLSGIREIVLDYRTGVLFKEQSVTALEQAITKFEGLRFSSQACIERAREFAEAGFISKLEWYIAQALDDYKQRGAIVL